MTAAKLMTDKLTDLELEEKIGWCLGLNLAPVVAPSKSATTDGAPQQER